MQTSIPGPPPPLRRAPLPAPLDRGSDAAFQPLCNDTVWYTGYLKLIVKFLTLKSKSEKAAAATEGGAGLVQARLREGFSLRGLAPACGSQCGAVRGRAQCVGTCRGPGTAFSSTSRSGVHTGGRALSRQVGAAIRAHPEAPSRCSRRAHLLGTNLELSP